ncbi:TetR/AcrR family transcriptional regulator [Sinomonas terrae]|uniref:TetR/AcrR family transcriptional regulator n=1 Tax=Sinomonas terrae TaxID=2908838 RepID=A0ABS9TXS8_9MICC|nr:TetR/AcrR family transcriptional regulator [Sinomonas terrae]MCH6469252.1 TetR/AcrR family transcriptional regulator [Sinomonas terrae]
MSEAPGPRGASGVHDERVRFRHDVAAAAVRLYAEQGYEATSTDQVASAVGLSRSTFFRQFRSKEDVVFADHDALLDEARAFLAEPHSDPWSAVCAAAELVFAHFAEQPELAQLRYEVVNREPSLRDKELVTTFRYERLFEGYLRAALPGAAPLDVVRFASTVIATHNYFLRGLMRGDADADAGRLRAELDGVRRLFGVLQGSDDAGGSRPREADDVGTSPPREADDVGTSLPREADDVVVLVFKRSVPASEVVRRVEAALDGPETQSRLT